ncbi:hypothetical protein DFP74_5741 [Nocardiopsis sp. Huas11]|uniref:hypothetical protein n=1 Tax=Nocardiopsis sp. Huas11 TaxID=2183912 RepID=UPI000EB37180|nr:hypothetical protein [Nocardiopsis sp. Huas11]RKS09995.1 hypothetical protein DFP74_5741 [Nocardiopsis sp. Huas11]
MVPPNTTTGRAPARGRRPQDAPRLSAVPSGPAPSPEKDAAAPAGLPDALANAVLGNQGTPKAPAARTAEPAPQRTDQPAARVPPPAPERDQDAQPTAPAATPTSADTPTETAKETALVAVEPESRSAADAERAITWLGVTYRPPDIWRERQPCLKEEWDFVMKGDHLPGQGPWRAAARGYAVPAIGLIGVLHFLIWILRSPARQVTAWVVAVLIAVSAALML